MRNNGSRFWRGTMKYKAGDPIDGDREKRSNEAIGHTESEPQRKAPFIWFGIAIDSPIRFVGGPKGLSEGELCSSHFCFPHSACYAAGLNSSASIASIT